MVPAYPLNQEKQYNNEWKIIHGWVKILRGIKLMRKNALYVTESFSHIIGPKKDPCKTNQAVCYQHLESLTNRREKRIQ